MWKRQKVINRVIHIIKATENMNYTSFPPNPQHLLLLLLNILILYKGERKWKLFVKKKKYLKV